MATALERIAKLETGEEWVKGALVALAESIDDLDNKLDGHINDSITKTGGIMSYIPLGRRAAGVVGGGLLGVLGVVLESVGIINIL